MTVIAIPEPLREKLGPEAAQALVDLFNRTAVQTREDVLSLVAEKFERRLSEELRALETRLLRWMFGFWLTTILAIVLALKT